MDSDGNVRLIFLGNVIDKMTIDMIRDFLLNEGGISVLDSPDAFDMKVGYCFVKCIDDGELEEKIHRVNGACIPGFEDRKITVEFTKTNISEQKKREERKRALAKPTDTLFVVGFDPTKMKPHYLEHEFESVAKVKLVEMVKSFAYCYFYTVEDAIAVKEAFDDKELFGKKLHLEFKQFPKKVDKYISPPAQYRPRDYYPVPYPPEPFYRDRSREREYRDPRYIRDDRHILRVPPPPPLYVRYDAPRRSRSRDRRPQPIYYDYLPPEGVNPRIRGSSRDRVSSSKSYSRYESIDHVPMDIPNRRKSTSSSRYENAEEEHDNVPFNRRRSKSRSNS